MNTAIQFFGGTVNRKQNPFISVWKTDNAGISGTNQIALPIYPGGDYNFKVFYNGQLLRRVTSHTDNVITFPDGSGEKEITITGKLNGWRFNDSGDSRKIIGIRKWGDMKLGNLGYYFWRCYNLSFIDDPELDLSETTSFHQAFEGTALTSFPAMNTETITSFGRAWYNSPLTSFPVLNSSNVINLRWAWRNTRLVTFPLMDFGKVTDAREAWRDADLVSFPPIDMPLVTDFLGAWWNCNLTSFPQIDMSSGTLFRETWRQNNLSSFPELDLSSGGNFIYAWRQNGVITDFKTKNLPNMDQGLDCFINSTLSTSDYSELLISLAANNLNTGVVFSGGSSKYNSTAIAARNALISRGWTITDAGLE